MTTPAYYYGTGRRKTAVARVRLLPGSGEIVVNDRSLEAHFGNAIDEANLRLPFRVTGTEGTFNAQIKVEGGGVTGQAGAIRHGIARARLRLAPKPGSAWLLAGVAPSGSAGARPEGRFAGPNFCQFATTHRRGREASAVCFSGGNTQQELASVSYTH